MKTQQFIQKVLDEHLFGDQWQVIPKRGLTGWHLRHSVLDREVPLGLTRQDIEHSIWSKLDENSVSASELHIRHQANVAMLKGLAESMQAALRAGDTVVNEAAEHAALSHRVTLGVELLKKPKYN